MDNIRCPLALITYLYNAHARNLSAVSLRKKAFQTLRKLSPDAGEHLQGVENAFS